MGTSPGLLDEIEQQRGKQKPGPRCAVALVFEALNDADAADLRAAFAGNHHSSSIGRALRSRGFTLSDYTVARHRRGNCSCEVGA